MRFVRSFKRIVKRDFPTNHQEILALTAVNFKRIEKAEEVLRKSNNPLDKRLKFTAYVLALIQALEFNKVAKAQIRFTCIDIAKDWVLPKNKFQLWLKRVPVLLLKAPFKTQILNRLHTKVSTLGHADGFRANILQEPKATLGFGYGVDILECGICKMYAKYQASNYVHLLCEIDAITTSLAGLEMIRTNTIANGGTCCDFRYKKKTHDTTS